MADIFIGYDRRDLAQAERLMIEIMHQGWSVWWDIQDIPPGTDFW